jgi:S-DNA-T family DNA segregation ATPase FtsK/SpoIIIE
MTLPAAPRRSRSAAEAEPAVEEARAPGARADVGVEAAVLDQAVRHVIAAGRASVTLLARRMRMGQADAARLFEQLRAHGVVDGERGDSSGRVCMDLEAWEEKSGLAPGEVL